MNPATFTFLGSGGSMGVPVIGCECSVCTSMNPKNKRMRPSGLLSIGEKRFLLDCGPDFHQQALQFKIHALDGIIFTHSHNDHTIGIDELRIYQIRSRKPLPCLLSVETARDLSVRFDYMFNKNPSPHKLVSRFDIQCLESDRGWVDFQGLRIKYCSFLQSGMIVNGYRFGNFAYISDIREYSETIFEDLQDVEILVLSALRYAPSPLHLSIDEAVEFAQRTGSKQTYLTHLAHELEYEQVNSYLPENIRLAYDGLEFSFKPDFTA